MVKELKAKSTAAVKGKGSDLNFSKENNFYIFGSIDETLPVNIIVPLIEYINDKAGSKEPGEINIHVSSYGGSVQYGFDLIAHIERAKSLGFIVNTYVSSVACSCGSLIAVTGTNRYVSERAYHLLHFARGADYAHNPVMIDRNAENFKFWQKELVNIYKKYTKLKDIEKLLLADNYMVNGAKDIIKVGLADFKL